MTSAPRRRAAALAAVLLGASVPFGAGAANAPASAEETTTLAGNVFTGEVVDATPVRVEGTRSSTTTYTVEVEDVYRGPLRSRTVEVQTSLAFGRCSVSPIEVGRRMILTSRAQTGSLLLRECTDAVSDTQAQRAVFEAAYGAPRPVVRGATSSDEDFAPVEFGETSTDSTPAFRRTAAPGLALVLVGLLGLVVTRLGRRRRS